MNNDMYLNLAIELYNNGTWDKETLIKKVTLYAQENNMDMTAINSFLNRLTNVKEYTIDDKRKILSAIKLGETELKYGDVVNSMSDEMIEKFYKSEEDSLGKDRIEKYYNIANNNVIKSGKEEENHIVVPEVPTKSKELTPKDIKIVGNITLEDVIYGNYTPDDLFGITEKDSDEIFDKLVSSVDERSFNTVVANLRGKLGIPYAGKFIEEWRKAHSSSVLQKEQESEKKTENKGFHKPEPIEREKSNEHEKTVVPTIIEFNPEPEKEESSMFHKPEPIEPEKSNEHENIIVPSFFKFNPELEKEESSAFHTPEPIEQNNPEISKDKEKVVVPSFAELNMPETEEEFKKIENVVTTPEKDSSVRKVNISPERLAKLKKTKNKVLNFSLKTIMLVAALNLLNPIAGIGLVGGYMYFASEIKCGNFNPTNPIGKAIKSTVEKIMYIGMGKDKKEEHEKEGGKTR